MDLLKKLSSLQEISKAMLSKILATNPNKKYFVIEPKLIKPLEKVCGVKWLKDVGVEKIYKLEEVAPNFDTFCAFYMIFSQVQTFKLVVEHMRSKIDIENPPKNKFHIIVVPHYLSFFEDELEQVGLFGVVTLHSFQWMPIHIDSRILSLEIPNVYKTLFIYEVTTLLPALSKALWQLCFVTGKPKLILSLGQFACSLVKQYEERCVNIGETDKPDIDFGALIVIDRNMDYASTLLTPSVYCALLKEVYNVTAGMCEEKPLENCSKYDEKFNPIVQKSPVSINMNSKLDSVYEDVKNRVFTEVTSVLSNLTKTLKAETTGSKEMALEEMKRYIQTQLQEAKLRKKLISNHLVAAEAIINVLGHRYGEQKDIEQRIISNSDKSENYKYLDVLLTTSNDQNMSLRLFCLLCITQGLSNNEIRSFWHKYLQHFGYKFGFGFTNLINAGFVPESIENSSGLNIPSRIGMKLPKLFAKNFYTNAMNLRQIPAEPEKINLKHPTCSSYVFGGIYIPLITQIANLLLNSTPLEEIKAKLEPLGQLSVKNDDGYPLQSRSILIYVIGGVTYAEITACNLLQTLMGTNIVVMSDKIISGNDIAQGILEMPS